MSFHQLVNHNPDLQRLRDEGYSIGQVGGYLVVRDIPYLNDLGMEKTGVIAAAMRLETPTKIAPPDDHQVLFVGEWPCHLDKRPIERLRGGVNQTLIGGDITSDFSFSNRPHNCPPNGYADFYDKIVAYCRIVCGPATAKSGRTPRNFLEIKSDDPESPFNFVDTMSSRAKIVELSSLFEGLKIGIIGLGGTGSYILDFLAKVPVQTIHLFDGDKFYVHNAFRAPGGFAEGDFGRNKADLFADRYAPFRKGVISHPWYVDNDHTEHLGECDFVFVCVDRGPARKEIVQLLRERELPFVDVGMGLRKDEGGLQGLVRTVFARPETVDALAAAKVFPEREAKDNMYQTDIQICELNALSGCLAAIMFKRSKGFYGDRLTHNYMLFNVASDKNSIEEI